MRRFAKIIGTALPLALAGGALAEDVVIRIEAKRGEAAAREAAGNWAQSFPDVVTFPLADGWFGIALGPLPRDEAAPRLEQLRAERQVPGDSFIAAAAGREITAVAGDEGAAEPGQSPSLFDAGTLGGTPAPVVGDADAQAENDAASAEPPAQADADAAPDTGDSAAEADAAIPAETVAEATAEPAPDESFILIESSADRARAEQALERHRATLPDAGLWIRPNGRHVVALGPFPRRAADPWLAALRNAGAVPRDAFIAPAAEMGEAAVPGSIPETGTLPDPERPAQMPPLEDIQRALRWAGAYAGDIDGKDGPMTRAAIASEVVSRRASPDTATAMNELIRHRDEWRAGAGLAELRDDHTGLSVPAPLDLLQFDRNERALSIYGPKDGSGAALILFSQPGGQQEMLDLTGLVTALGWVPSPQRRIARGSAVLTGRNDSHIGHAEARVADGRAEGFVLIWPAGDAEDQTRLAAEISDGFARFAAPGNDAEFGASDARNGKETAPEPQAAQAGPDTSP